MSLFSLSFLIKSQGQNSGIENLPGNCIISPQTPELFHEKSFNHLWKRDIVLSGKRATGLCLKPSKTLTRIEMWELIKELKHTWRLATNIHWPTCCLHLASSNVCCEPECDRSTRSWCSQNMPGQHQLYSVLGPIVRTQLHSKIQEMRPSEAIWTF